MSLSVTLRDGIIWNWHIGEPLLPMLPSTDGCTLQADGHELSFILVAMRLARRDLDDSVRRREQSDTEARATERDRAARRELEAICGRTATLSGNLRQFQMSTSKSCPEDRKTDEVLLELQEHVEALYLMVQRVCAILLEDVL